jgi:hypothetical protein
MRIGGNCLNVIIMEHLIVVAHPVEDSALMRAYAFELHRLWQNRRIYDLYRMRFNPILERPSDRKEVRVDHGVRGCAAALMKRGGWNAVQDLQDSHVFRSAGFELLEHLHSTRSFRVYLKPQRNVTWPACKRARDSISLR